MLAETFSKGVHSSRDRPEQCVTEYNSVERIGDSRFSVHRLENGNIHLLFKSAIAGNVRTNAKAEFKTPEAKVNFTLSCNALYPSMQNAIH